MPTKEESDRQRGRDRGGVVVTVRPITVTALAGYTERIIRIELLGFRSF